MTQVQVEQLTFDFAVGVLPFQYEKAGAVVNGWPAGSKVVDVVASDATGAAAVAWFIEAKDFRIITYPPRPVNLTGLPQTVNKKVRDTITGMAAVGASSNDPAAKAHATATLPLARRRIVLHLEPHPPGGGHSYLFPRGFAASVLMKLRQLMKDIDRNPLVLDLARTPAAGVPWTVA